MSNIFSPLPENLEEEMFEDLVKGKHVRIERIVSNGQSSPSSGWYDQSENEWVMVLGGSGMLSFENDDEVLLSKGDYIDIPAHTKHRVAWTAPDEPTIWLAVFYT
ncbi:MAG: cupin domain-containing protein [Chromatiaceae bacterium]|jgi:cupin 2 domain-containing protein|nr:cupin domain-containing protein [Chromatiaceae bacterium]